MISRENEEVPFSQQIVVTDDPTIYVWLGKIENQMRASLAESLGKCAEGITEGHDIMEVANAAPSQIALLGLQVDWSKRVEECIPNATLSEVEAHSMELLVKLAVRVLEKLPT